MLTVLSNGLIPSPLALGQLVGSPLVAPAVVLYPLILLQCPLVILVENERSKGEILLANLFDSRVGVVDHVNTLKLEIENLGEVDVVERVRLVNLVFQGLGRRRRRFVIVEGEFGRGGRF